VFTLSAARGGGRGATKSLLVCNAGLTRHNSLLNLDVEQIDFIYNLNFRSYLLCSSVAWC